MAAKHLTLLLMSITLPLHMACSTPAPNADDDLPKEQTTTPNDTPTTPPSITGSYAYNHTIMVMGSEEEEDEEVTDCLALTEEGDTLRFSVSLVQANEHSCALSGKATKQSDGSFLYTEEIEDEGTCKFIITIKDATIDLTDVDDICRSYYCGMRASFDSASFQRSTQDTSIKVCDAE